MSFSQLGLNPNILKAVKEQGYTSPTPIQKESIPVILNHKDVLAAAQTGTGKTAAFTLPLLEKMSQKPNKKGQKSYIKALILAPTRELALQVSENIQTYSKYLSLKTAVIFGGVGISPQKASLRKGVDIVIATPGRLLDHMSQKTIDLSRVEFLVLDEADRMLDMGFIHDIKKVVASIPNKRQTLLFSATFSPEIKKLSNSFLDNPKLIEVARSNALSEQVSQVVHYVQKDKKKNLLAFLIHTQKWNQVLVFTRTKHGANKLSEFLNKSNIPSLAIHGNKSQGARTSALSNFKSKKIRVLVATDIAARGIDIELLPHVVNFELPNVPEDYVHRIGRTGRAGNNGIALSLVCDEESQYLKDIERLTKISIPVKDIEGFTVPLLKKVNKKSDSKNGSVRNSVSI
ncbi:ATP-dependent RNA helicase RhlE [Malaciobacter marinus]|uniref:DEAD/DEAH box helicase n=1 Tax=Malaciobacter marinus TaxID=505249 RepID=UPI000C0802CD|nr:DEAD/DEAH box helicase [Malaciobacter marinus]PHO11854.1 ATP-dependent RNA helicase RhlE [Malaciobacter marinus]